MPWELPPAPAPELCREIDLTEMPLRGLSRTDAEAALERYEAETREKMARADARPYDRARRDIPCGTDYPTHNGRESWTEPSADEIVVLGKA